MPERAQIVRWVDEYRAHILEELTRAEGNRERIGQGYYQGQLDLANTLERHTVSGLIDRLPRDPAAQLTADPTRIRVVRAVLVTGAVSLILAIAAVTVAGWIS